jgi:hypothetical protein
VDVAAIWQARLDPPHIGFELFLAVAEPSIDRKLALLKTFIQQEFAEFRCRARLFPGCHGQVEHHENPHQSVSA